MRPLILLLLLMLPISLISIIVIFISYETVGNIGLKIKATVEWDDAQQSIDGFGTFHALNTRLYDSKYKEEVMGLLFDENGLQLNILRGELFPDSENGSRITNRKHLAQLWAFKHAQNKYNITKLFVSTWSPPPRMKSIPKLPGEGMNRLKPENYPNFAIYMIQFIKLYEKNGVNLFAVSPQNEPEYPTTNWSGCVWWPFETAEFVTNYLRPSLNRANMSNIKVIIGEVANWNVADLYLSLLPSNVIDSVDYLATHGYSLPNLKTKEVTFNTEVLPQILSKHLKRRRWITEISDTTGPDLTMVKGLRFGESLHRFLINNVTGFVYWLGFENFLSGEGLINMKNDTLVLSKVYDVYGHFTRYIKPGYVRMSVSLDLIAKFYSIYISAYKDPISKKFSIVIINREEKILPIILNGIRSKSVIPIVTDDVQKWVQMETIYSNSSIFKIKIPQLSIITLIGVEGK